jgi:hypothetical protein
MTELQGAEVIAQLTDIQTLILYCIGGVVGVAGALGAWLLFFKNI